MSAAHLVPGAVFGGDFRVVSPLSEGGMGAVYVVEQLSTGKQRALKVMQPSIVSDERLRQRFVQEARIGARIESEHIVEVVGAGVDAASGVPWLAMELLRGETLAARIRRLPLSPAEAREIFAQLGHALAAAHDAGIVHRDLKPENIFLAASRRQGSTFTVKVLDFGIAKLVAEAHTRSTAPMGTALWMAPEQTEAGRGVEPATDVWALGLIAFHVLTGHYYWRSAYVENASPMTMVRELVVDPLPPIRARARELGVDARLPSAFDDWFARCVDRSVERRYPHAREAIAALDRALAATPEPVARPVTAPSTQPWQAPVPQAATAPMPAQMTPIVAPGTTATPTMSAPAAAEPGVDTVRSGPTPTPRWIGVVAISAVFVIGLGLLALRGSNPEPKPSPAKEPSAEPPPTTTPPVAPEPKPVEPAAEPTPEPTTKTSPEPTTKILAPTPAPAPKPTPAPAPAPTVSSPPIAGSCPSYKGDYSAAMRGKDYECVRTMLLPRLNAGTISSSEARYLKAACLALSDYACQKRAAEKI